MNLETTHWVIEGDSAQAALESQGYTGQWREKRHGVWWLGMVKKTERPAQVITDGGPAGLLAEGGV